jgi:hypothetical protein
MPETETSAQFIKAQRVDIGIGQKIQDGSMLPPKNSFDSVVQKLAFGEGPLL